MWMLLFVLLSQEPQLRLPLPHVLPAEQGPHYQAVPEANKGWWVLMSGGISIPQAMGPYPSLEFCRIAANKVMPEERMFWTPEQVKAADEKAAKEKADAERREAEEKAYIAEMLPKTKANKRGERRIALPSGVVQTFDAKGKWIGSTSYGTGSEVVTLSAMTRYFPLTGCVEIK